MVAADAVNEGERRVAVTGSLVVERDVAAGEGGT
jgi:hypothetical protein